MRKADVFEVKTSQREPEPRILLARPGEDAGVAINAAALLAQYQLGDGDVLIVLDEDDPFEQALHLVLLQGTRIIDHVAISAPYAGGIYREVSVEGETLSFLFENEVIWRVSSDRHGSRGLRGLPSGAHRRGGWLTKRYLSLSRGTAA